MKEGVVVLSLFDGMSCGQLALHKLGIKVKTYYASEIDKHAIKVTQHNFPNTIQLGDVTQVKGSDLPKIDLLIGGSPCQGFSFAGKQLAFDDPRSKLFFEFVRLKNECKPTYFLLENVRMKKEYELIISRYMGGVAPIEINSALLSAQNRERIYWTNIANEPYCLFGDMACAIPQPKDKGILLKDILETDVPEKYYLSDTAIKRMDRKQSFVPQINPEKTGTLNTKNNSGQLSVDNGTTLIKVDVNGKPKPNQDKDIGVLNDHGNFIKIEKSTCIDSNYFKGMDNHTQITMVATLTPKRTEYGKTNTLTSVQKDNLVIQLNPSTESNGTQPYQQNRVYSIDGISPALLADMSSGTHAILDKSPCLHGFEHGTNGQFNNQLLQGGLIRRLTPTECKRLQTVPDWYDISVVSDTQQYRMLGNGWTVDVIAHIFSYMDLKQFNL